MNIYWKSSRPKNSLMTTTPQKLPNPRARLAGTVYLLYFLTAVLAQALFTDKPSIYIAINLVAYSCYVTLAILFYHLFRPVNKIISLLAAVCGLCGSSVGVLDLFHLAPYHLSPLVFFGPYCLLIGILVMGSRFLPMILGLLMIAAGIGWLIFLTPGGKSLISYIEIVGIAAEAFLMFWLIIKGVNPEKWRQQLQKS